MATLQQPPPIDPEDARAALKEVGTLSSVIITVSVATLALSANLLKGLDPKTDLVLLWWSWALLLVSVVWGFLALMEQIGRIAGAKFQAPLSGLLPFLNAMQLLFALTGIVLLGLFSVNALQSGAASSPQPAVRSPTACPKQEDGHRDEREQGKPEHPRDDPSPKR